MIRINDTLREIFLGNNAFGIQLGDSRDLVRSKIGDPVVWEGITDVLPASSRIWDYGAVQIFFQGTSTVQLLKVIFSEFFRDTLETDFTRADLGIDKSTKILPADLESMLFHLGLKFEHNIGGNKCPEYFFSSNCRAMFAPEAIFIGNQRKRGPVQLFTIDIGWPPNKD